MAAEIVQFLSKKFNSDFQKHKDQVPHPLRTHFQALKDFLEQNQLSATVEKRNALYSLNDALMECQMRSEERKEHKRGSIKRYSLSDLWFVYKTKKNLLEIKEKLQETETGVPHSAINNNPDTKIRSSKIHGFETQVKKIQNLLLKRRNEDKLRTIGIVGMGGSGKTSLSRLIFDSERIQEEFNPTIWCPVSHRHEEKKDVRSEILEYILEYLGEYLQTGMQIEELLRILHSKLIGRRYLIVFDDVWHINEWYKNLIRERENGGSFDCLAYGLPKGDGGAVIVTSRLKEVAEEMVGEANLHHIEPLMEESCWSIFMDSIDKGETELISSTLKEKKMKKEILNNCNGVPLAAKTLGEIISKQIIEKNKANP